MATLRTVEYRFDAGGGERSWLVVFRLAPVDGKTSWEVTASTSDWSIRWHSNRRYSPNQASAGAFLKAAKGELAKQEAIVAPPQLPT